MRTIHRHGQRGQVLPVIAFSMIPLIAVAALAVDVGVWRYQQQLAQIAADSGAVAAVVELENAGSLGTYAAANVDTTANGFPGVNNPPASGMSTNNYGAVEVIVQKKIPAYLGYGTTTVSARSVAITQSNCLVALDTANAVVMNIFRGTLSMPNCGVAANGQLAMADTGITPEPVVYAKTLGYRF